MNAAQVIPFKKPSQPKQEAAKNMYSEKFEQGYVMSSRLYRKEVWPFLSDAARNVYAELENRINGHNKESDFVSYSQLQGGELPGSRKLGRTTVSNALQELIKLGVISVVSNGKQGMKSYRLNEISLKDRFTNKTSPVTVPVQQQDQTSTASEPVTSPVTGHTIDNSIDSLENNSNNPPANFEPQNRPMLQFVEYHPEDKKIYSLRELTRTYPAQSDFTAQAKVSFPKLTDDEIWQKLCDIAQWSVDQPARTAQKWMSTWLTSCKNIGEKKPAQPKVKAKQPEKKKYHRYGQGVINP
ncbi:hypothetical protein [Acinetobacter sp. YH12090]|uniref:hypothetical protein n=1 Tax=Acinetobacter sp. YH12090 TaxID=2601081 RepID=UPI0015D3A1D1|nr:hypothetical protein [Acinetobacter sp. YH12090]